MARNRGGAPGSANEPPAQGTNSPSEAAKSGGATEGQPSKPAAPSATPASAQAKNGSGSQASSAAPSSARTSLASQSGAGAGSGGRPATPPGTGASAGGTGAGKQPAGGGGGGTGGQSAGPPRSSGGGWLKGLFGGLVGGAATWAAINYGLEQPTPQIERLQAQIDAVEGGAATATGFDPSAFQARIDELEARLAEAGEQGGGPAGSELEALETSLAEAEGRIEQLETDLEAAAAAGGETTDPAARQALETVESRLQELVSRVDQVESGAGTGDPAAVEQLAALGAQIDGLRSEIETQLTGLSGRVDGIQGEVAGLAERAAALSSRLDALEAEIESTQERIDQVGLRRDSAATIALVTGRIRQAILDGEPFTEQVEALEPVAERDPLVAESLEGLEPAADTGVPTMAELRTRFHEIANDIVHEAQSPEGDGLLNQAAGSLMKLVSVREIGADVEGSDPEAIVARAEAKLQADDLEGALAELDDMAELPEAAAAWRVRADARLKALSAQERLEAHATELLEGARS